MPLLPGVRPSTLVPPLTVPHTSHTCARDVSRRELWGPEPPSLQTYTNTHTLIKRPCESPVSQRTPCIPEMLLLLIDPLSQHLQM